MSVFSDKLKLQGVEGADEKLCRDAFATLPEHVQKLVTESGLTFYFTRGNPQPVFSNNIMKVPFTWIEESRNHQGHLPSLFLSGLAVCVSPPPAALVNNAIREYWTGVIALSNKHLSLDTQKPILPQLTPKERQEYNSGLSKYLGMDLSPKVSDILEGIDRRRHALEKGQPDPDLKFPVPLCEHLYDYYLGESARLATGHSLSDKLIIKSDSPELEAKCRQAFARLPMYVQEKIIAAKVEYEIVSPLTGETMVMTTPGKARFLYNTVNTLSVSELSSALGGHGLAASLKVIVPFNLLFNAAREYHADANEELKARGVSHEVMNESRLDNTSESRRIVEEGKHTFIGDILAWHLEGAKQNDPQKKARKALCDLCLQDSYGKPTRAKPVIIQPSATLTDGNPHLFSDRLKLEGVSPEEEKRCRDAFATLPDYVQKVIVDKGIMFRFSDDVAEGRFTDGKVIALPHNHLNSSLLYLGLFGFGLALIGPKPPMDALNKIIHDRIVPHALLLKNNLPADFSADNLASQVPPQLRPALAQGRAGALNTSPELKIALFLVNSYPAVKENTKMPPKLEEMYRDYMDGIRRMAEEQTPADQHQYSNRLKLEGVAVEDEKRCRDAFATLPEHVQKLIADTGIVFEFKKGKMAYSNENGKSTLSYDWIEDARTDPNTLSSILLSHGLALSLLPPPPSLVQAAATEHYVRAYTDEKGLQVDPSKPFLSQLSAEDRQQFHQMLPGYMAGSTIDKAADAMQGAYRSLALKRKWLLAGSSIGPEFKDGAAMALYRYYLGESERIAAGTSYSDQLIIKSADTGLEAKCRQAFARLPLYIQKSIINAKVEFDITPPPINPGELSVGIPGKIQDTRIVTEITAKGYPIIKHGKVSFIAAEEIYGHNPCYLSSALGGYGLAAALNMNALPNRIFANAVREQTADMAEHLRNTGGQSGADISQMLAENSEAVFRKMMTERRFEFAGTTIEAYLNGAPRLTQKLTQKPSAAKEELCELCLKMAYEAAQNKPAVNQMPATSAADDEERKAEELRRAEEDAKRPRPYKLALGETNAEGSLAKDELIPLAAAFDCRFAGHQALADILFNGHIIDIAEAYLSGQPGVVRSLFNPGKHPQNDKALDAAKAAVESLFSKPADQIPPEEREATEAVKQQLLRSPVFLALLLHKQNVMEAAEQWQGADEKEFYVMDNTSGLLRKYWPKLAEIVLPPLPEKPVELPRPLPPEQAAESVLPPPALVEAPPPPSPESLLPAAVSIGGIAAGAAAIEMTKPEPKPEPKPELEPIPLTPDEMLKLNHLEAFDKACNRAVNDAEMHALTVSDQGYTRFQCTIDLKSDDCPIIMTFANEKGQVQKFRLSDYASLFPKDSPMTLEDAVNIKIAVQSMVLNQSTFEPLRDASKGGIIGVDIDHMLPIHAKDPHKRKTSVNAGGGVLTWKIVAPDRDGRANVNVSIPLGLPDEPQNQLKNEEVLWIDHKGPKPEHLSETAERVKVIMDFIESNGSRQCWVTKREVNEALDRYITANNKEWVVHENIPLPGYGQGKILYNVTDEQEKPIQKITLSPVMLRMEPGGDNPSWHLDFTLHANNDPNDTGYGEAIRGRSQNLHTSNRELALARANEAMNGISNNAQLGFMEMMAAQARQHPHDRWVKIGNDGGRHTAMVGRKYVQDFLDDMIHFEHDLDIQCIKPPPSDKDEPITFTLKALRANLPDRGGKAKKDPRVVCIKDDKGNRQEIQMVLTAPESQAGKIDAFVDKVRHDLQWQALEEYSSIALNPRGGESGRKDVKEYRKASVRNLLTRAVKLNYQAFFGVPYVDNSTDVETTHAGAKIRGKDSGHGATAAVGS